MKRIITGAFAAIIAIAFSAFTTTPKKPLTTYYFAFDYVNYSPTQTNVQSDFAWKEDTPTACPTSDNQKACKIEVDASDTHLDGSIRKLNTGIVITASRFGLTSNYFVSGGSDVVSIMNQHL